MSLKSIFEDASAPKASSGSDDLVGKLTSGYQVDNTPVGLTEWRIVTGDPDVAQAVAAMYGGAPDDWETKSEYNIQVFTNVSSLTLLIDGPNALRSDMRLYANGKLAHHCDGSTSMFEDEKGQPCGCPSDYKARKDKADTGRGPKPSIRLFGKLADDVSLGKFLFSTGSWQLAKDLGRIEDKLAEIDGPTLVSIEIEHVEYTDRAGKLRQYNRPHIKVLGAAGDMEEAA